MFLIYGGEQDFGGWRMLRVLDGGSLRVDFMERIDIDFDVSW